MFFEIQIASIMTSMPSTQTPGGVQQARPPEAKPAFSGGDEGG